MDNTQCSDGVNNVLTSCHVGLQLELERRLRALLQKEKEKAEEEAGLALGICGTSMLP